MKKILALVLALAMVFALCACGGAKSEAGGDDLAQWKAYLKEYAAAGAPSEEAGQSLMAEIDAAATVEEVEGIAALSVMFGSVGALHYNDWIAAGKPAADTSNMGDPTAAVSGEPTGEPSGEPAA